MNNPFEKKRILVAGLGRSGKALIHVLKDEGAQLSVQDAKPQEKIDSETMEFLNQNGIKAYLGEKPDNLENLDMVVLSPGVPPDTDFILEAEAHGAEIVGELEVAYRICRGTFVAITGTNGKTTTTTLTGAIFKKSFAHSYIEGNIGIPAVTVAENAENDSWLVTECSSFQLETIRDFHPHISAMLNITPDHLNRHKTMENYVAAKSNVFACQTEEDYFVFNQDDEICRKEAEKCRAIRFPFSRKQKLDTGAFVEDGNIVIRDSNGIHTICKLTDLKIIGDHNVENVLAAAAISFCAGITKDIIADAIRNFHGVEHRIEFAGEKNGVKFYNDSKGTNTDATLTAVKAIKENIILLAGGDSKKQDFVPLINGFRGAVKKLVIYGRDGEDLKKACISAGFSDYVLKDNLESAFKEAVSSVEAGDTVLLSPACASWDCYVNFEARGNHFKEMVKEYLDENI